MKLLSSLKKELILASRSFYFYVEILFAGILLAVLLFAIPEEAHLRQTRFVYLDLPSPAAAMITDSMLESDYDGKLEDVTFKSGGEKYDAKLILNDKDKIYFLGSEAEVIALADKERDIGAVVTLDPDGALHYKYLFQGYESIRLKNLISVIHNIDSLVLEDRFDEQDVVSLSNGSAALNDRENAIPPLLAFNSCLMGMFIMAAYVFLDKKEGVLKAYAVTASSVSDYLMSKILVVLLTAAASGLVILLPVMGFTINYWLALLLLLTSGFFSSVVGLLIASFYEDITEAFGIIFFILILLMLPMISYFLPGWNPLWIRFIPSDPIIQSLKEIVSNGSVSYPVLCSAGFLAAGVVLFFFTDRRYKKTLNV